MPPRPRPRPKPRTTPADQPSGSSAAAGSSLITKDDEDNLFLRNKHLTAQTWKELNKRSEEVVVVDPDINVDDSPRKNRKKVANHNSLPSWTLPQARARLTAVDAREDEVVDLYEDSSDEDQWSRPKLLNRSSKNRKRSRSRSITPPPQLTFAQKQAARVLVRDTLGITTRRATSPKRATDSGEDSMDIELTSGPAKPQNYIRSSSNQISLQTSEGHMVSIRVRWKPHPLNKTGQAHVWDFSVRQNDTFRQIFDETADSTQTLVDDLVMSYKGRRIYSSVSPASMDIWTAGELDACDKRTFEYMRTNNIRFTTVDHSSQGPSAEMVSEDGGSESDSDDVRSTSEGPQGASDTFKLTLRSAKAPKDIILTVRPSTKCGAIVKAFLKKAGLADKYLEEDRSAAVKTNKRRGGRKSLVVGVAGPRLMIDGDKMSNETEIGDADLEDGDMVEVVGL